MVDRPTLEYELPVTASAPALARRAVGGLTCLPEPWLSDAALIVSELVTNALIHGGLLPTDTIRVRLRFADGHLVMEVVERPASSSRRSSENVTGPRERSPGAGVGLKIVARLADEWHVEPGRAWASLPVP